MKTPLSVHNLIIPVLTAMAAIAIIALALIPEPDTPGTPGTPTNQLPIENRVLALRDLMYADATIDRDWWGWPGQGGQCNFPPGITLSSGVNILITDFIERGILLGGKSAQ